MITNIFVILVVFFTSLFILHGYVRLYSFIRLVLNSDSNNNNGVILSDDIIILQKDD